MGIHLEFSDKILGIFGITLIIIKRFLTEIIGCIFEGYLVGIHEKLFAGIIKEFFGRIPEKIPEEILENFRNS